MHPLINFFPDPSTAGHQYALIVVIILYTIYWAYRGLLAAGRDERSCKSMTNLNVDSDEGAKTDGGQDKNLKRLSCNIRLYMRYHNITVTLFAVILIIK